MPRHPNAPQCGAKTRKDTPCPNSPRKGATRCRMHGGSAPQVQAAVERKRQEDVARKAVETYGLKADVDPITALLDEVQWTAGHVAWLRDRVREIEQKALVWGVTETVSKMATEFPGVDVTEGAAPNIWLTLYQKERAHLVAVCKAAISAGIEERRVRLAERQGDLIALVLQRILGDLDLSDEQRARVPEVAARRLREMSELALAA